MGRQKGGGKLKQACWAVSDNDGDDQRKVMLIKKSDGAVD